jgi:ABC-type multidrug transport system ATPase subunit
VCTRVAIVASGQIAYEGPLDELLARAGRRYRLQTADLPVTVEICRSVRGLSGVEVDSGRIGFAIDAEAALLELAGALTEAEIAIQSMTPEQVTLERVFSELTEAPMSAPEVTV